MVDDHAIVGRNINPDGLTPNSQPVINGTEKRFNNNQSPVISGPNTSFSYSSLQLST